MSGRLILASASPRRQQLLGQIGLTPDAVASRRDDADTAVDPVAASRKQAQERSGLVRRFRLRHDPPAAGDHSIGAKDESVPMVPGHGLGLIPGQSLDQLARQFPFQRSLVDVSRLYGVRRTVVTNVQFKRLSGPEIDAYIGSGEWEGKAGAYAVQGRAAVFVKSINGSYSNVVGLPLFETSALLKGLGFNVEERVNGG